MQVKLKSITPGAETNIVEIARVSSSRTDKTEKPEGLINYLIKNKHWSPFEHAYMTVEIVTSKAIGIQLLRHVSFRFQEFSQRYAKVDRLEDMEFRLQAEKNRQSSTEVMLHICDVGGGHFITAYEITEDKVWEDLSEEICDYLRTGMKLYTKMLDKGIAKECARFILPMATQTTIYMTGSIRSWIHMLEIRDDGHAQKEVQLIAKDIKKLFINELPIISNALNWTNDGRDTESRGDLKPPEGRP